MIQANTLNWVSTEDKHEGGERNKENTQSIERRALKRSMSMVCHELAFCTWVAQTSKKWEREAIGSSGLWEEDAMSAFLNPQTQPAPHPTFGQCLLFGQ